MKVEILGTGCYNCLKLEELVNRVILEFEVSGVEVERWTTSAASATICRWMKSQGW